ncbi:hypothetical protein NKH77_12635 [Streptomyces sp. M19]
MRRPIALLVSLVGTFASLLTAPLAAHAASRAPSPQGRGHPHRPVRRHGLVADAEPAGHGLRQRGQELHAGLHHRLLLQGDVVQRLRPARRLGQGPDRRHPRGRRRREGLLRRGERHRAGPGVHVRRRAVRRVRRGGHGVRADLRRLRHRGLGQRRTRLRGPPLRGAGPPPAGPPGLRIS